MKKTLIALAAIAAVGAASAQVTVYGKLDVAYTNSSAGSSVGLNGWETSRFGVKAEDKMGGMTASVVLEGKLRDNTNGQAAFQGFDRTATVGLAGSFGAVTIGNQWTPVDNAIWTTDALEYNGFTPLAAGLWNADVGNTGMAFAAVARFTEVFLAGGFLVAALSDFLTAGWCAFMGFLATGFLAGIGQTPQRGLGFH